MQRRDTERACIVWLSRAERKWRLSWRGSLSLPGWCRVLHKSRILYLLFSPLEAGREVRNPSGSKRRRMINCRQTIHRWIISLSREVRNSGINLLVTICSLWGERKADYSAAKIWATIDSTLLLQPQTICCRSCIYSEGHTLCPLSLLFHFCSCASSIAL